MLLLLPVLLLLLLKSMLVLLLLLLMLMTKMHDEFLQILDLDVPVFMLYYVCIHLLL